MENLGQTPDTSSILKAVFFSSLLPQEGEFVLSRTEQISLPRGGRLFSPGLRAERFYLVQKGRIRVYRADGNWQEEMAHFTQGDIIGDFDFARRAEYDAFAEAAEDSVLTVFPGFGLSLEQLSLESPETAVKILLNCIVMITRRIKETRKIMLENLSWTQELYRRAYEDPGTGLWKQSFLSDEMSRILEEPAAIIMLKPDRFKILVDSLGHDVGDRAMISIAMVLKRLTRIQGRGWPLRLKSNETAILINKYGPSHTQALAERLHREIAALPPVPPQGDFPGFSFSGTVVWGVWPQDNPRWEDLFQGVYDLLLETWRAGGGQPLHYCKKGSP